MRQLEFRGEIAITRREQQRITTVEKAVELFNHALHHAVSALGTFSFLDPPLQRVKFTPSHVRSTRRLARR